jgi:uncharacterized protein (DUF2236 family)
MDAQTPDPGLFGPHSLTWRVHADPVMWVAGLRALYLQALHPQTVRGVFTHSGFREDPWGRLVRTADYVGVLTYGTRGQAEDAARTVFALHRRLGVDDPHLLAWVHHCEVDSFWRTYQRAGGDLSAAEADAYLEEQTLAARMVGLDPSTVPATVAQARAYEARMRPELALTPEAREAARFVLAPPMPTPLRLLTPAQPAWVGMSALAFSLLPRWARRLYRMPGLRIGDLQATVALRTLRTALRCLPDRVRKGPHLRSAEQRLAAGAATRQERVST